MTLDDVIIDKNCRKGLAYAKVRYIIEERLSCRKAKRDAKMTLIEHLGGSIQHPSDAQSKRGATKMVVFDDDSRAKF